MSRMKTLVNGIIKENPTFVLVLGMCPTLGTTTSAINGMSIPWYRAWSRQRSGFPLSW